MATVTARASSETAPNGSTRFVPIRPAFRPLLPKPSAAHHDTQGHNEPTVVFKSQHTRRITKKRKEQHSSINAAAVVAAHSSASSHSGSSSSKLPATISPASLMAKRQRTPPGEEDSSKSRLTTPVVMPSSAENSPILTSTAPVLSLADDTATLTPFSTFSVETPSTPLSLFNQVEDQHSLAEEFADAGLDGVAGLNFDQFESESYLGQVVDAHSAEIEFFTSNMDMFS